MELLNDLFTGRIFKKMVLLLAAGLSAGLVMAQTGSGRYPNIVFILADDMGYGDVSCNNPDARIRTVNIDRLANNGMRFTAAHTTSSVCTPSRYSILTGRYNWRSRLKKGVLGGYGPPLIDSSRLTIADVLKNKGYRTACIGKWHIGLEYATTDQAAPRFDTKTGATNIAFEKPLRQSPNDLGFDYYYGIAASADMPPYMYIENRKFIQQYDGIKGDPKYTRTDMGRFFRPGPASNAVTPEGILPDITLKAKQYIEEQSAAHPFFLYFSLTAPHKPISPAASFVGKSGIHAYLDFCLQVDETVGAIVNTLKKKGLYEHTLIIFTSDNGFAPYVDARFIEDHGHYPSFIYRGYKADAWEGGHRVPMIVQWPGKIIPRTVTTEVVSLADWFATVSGMVHTPVPDNAAEDSYDLMPLLSGAAYRHPLREATVCHSIKGEFAIQQQNWKLILCNEKTAGSAWVPDKRYDSLQAATPFLLYDLESDPGETNNLYSRYPGKVKELKALLTRYIREGRSTKGTIQKNDAVDKWPQISWMK
ncbi:sulfatase family protein [Niabella aurantiaca]|uniref:sulfatase family protein n=1 Tax=Niabella aurantiaca TaxID=379900 RepID=UPI0003662741|nr:arylsulfatase [Niabella aurantiaca]